MLNWIYIDKTTKEVKHGTGSASRENEHGSWGFAEETGEMQINGDSEGWVAVEEPEGSGVWALFHDGEEVSEEGEEGDLVLEGREFFKVEVVRVPID